MAQKREVVMKVILAILVAFATVTGAVAAQAQMKLPEMKKQLSAQAVLDEHFDALNKCDWNRIVAQYPEDAQINLPGGAVVKGRAAIGDMFAGFCKDSKDGGLKGINFKAESSAVIGDTLAVQWVATAPFLAEPYKGSDAYITKDGLMQAMVSTFDGGALKMKK
jgi:ketosteroid isomerase-like protein